MTTNDHVWHLTVQAIVVCPDDPTLGCIELTYGADYLMLDVKAQRMTTETTDEGKAVAIAALQHVAEICLRNDDGSVTLGTQDIKNIEAAITFANNHPRQA